MGDWSALNRLGPTAVAAIYLRAELRCAHCLCRTVPGRRQVDHVIPRVEGGSDDPSNLVLACSDCNRRKIAGFLTPKARRYGRTKAEVNSEIARQVSIPIGRGSDIYARAATQGRQWWPDQYARHSRARAKYLATQADRFDFGFAMESA